jgi:glutamine amidotransferase
MGNLFSVRNTFSSLGIKADILTSPEKISSYGKLVLPGVGAFGDAMRELTKRGVASAIRDFAAEGGSLLGICLGMQLLFEASEEARGVRGLSLIPGSVKRFGTKLKCPHMGWNEIEKKGIGLAIFKNIRGPVYTYFCHSYYCRPVKAAAVIGVTEYGARFASIVKQGNVYGMQFHPEKSQETGLKLLKNFIRFC